MGEAYLNGLRDMGYKGSDAFTYEDAMTWAAESPTGWQFVCLHVLNIQDQKTCEPHNSPFLKGITQAQAAAGGAIQSAAALAWMGVFLCVTVFVVECVTGAAEGELAFDSGLPTLAGLASGLAGADAAAFKALQQIAAEGGDDTVAAVRRLLQGSCLSSFGSDTRVVLADGTSKPISRLSRAMTSSRGIRMSHRSAAAS